MVIRKGNVIKSGYRPHAIKYMELYPYSKNHRIWADVANSTIFSQAQYRKSMAGKDFHFNCPVDTWKNHSQYGCRLLKGTSDKWAYNKSYGTITNNEIIYGNHPLLQNNQNKSVLVIAGGPSVNQVKWENLEFDQIWTCNQFFLNEKVSSKKIDLVTVVGSLFDYVNEKRFTELIKRDNTLVSLESERGHVEFDRDEFKKAEQFCRLYPENSTFFHTRYRPQLGVGLRLVVYAAMAGFRDIYFVGIDGRSKSESDNSLLHAFEKNKPVPNWYKNYGNIFQDRQFVIFWDYLQSLSVEHGFNFYNLGEGTEHNRLSHLFSHKFPLPEHIRKRLL